MPRKQIALGLILAAACPMLLFPESGGAALKSIWGPVRLPDGRPAFPIYRELGVEDYQAILKWADVARTRPANPRNPNDPAYAWPAEITEAVAEAKRHGIGATLLLNCMPAWANGGRGCNWATIKPSDFGDFAVAASRRYPHVRRWMILGEPNAKSNFEPLEPSSASGPRRYARLLDAAYVALKRQSRRDVVIGGNAYTAGDYTPVRWLKRVRLPSGRPPRLDWWGHNPYTSRFPDLDRQPLSNFVGWRDFSDMDTFLREVRHAYRKTGRRPRLWLSEFTIQSDHGSGTFYFYVSRREQAAWVTAAYRIADRLKGIAGLGWFTLIDTPENSNNQSANWGLLTHDGKPKPSYYAYKRVR
jgi:hypothetical protein